MYVESHGNHVWKHRKKEETQEDHFVNPQAYTGHSHGTSGHWKNPIRCRGQAVKNSGRNHSR